MSMDLGNGATMPAGAAAQGSRAMRVLLFGLFFLSGLSALAYQTAWQRMLGAFVGSDAVGTTMIVSAFLFGLGIGSLVGASFADWFSLRGALRAFALCEIGVGGFACFSPTVFHDLFPVQFAGLAGDPLGGWVIIVLALLLPTVLMGMSLPLLSRVLVDTIEGASARIGWLYGMNTIGAAAGAVLTGWVLIGTFGFTVTVDAAAVTNVLIGVSAWLAAGRFPSIRPRPASGMTPGGAPESGRLPLVWPAMVFASGFLIISLEILWFRVVGTLMQSDAYAFSLILGMFLFGDGLGIIVGSLIAHRLTHPRRAFQLLQGVMGLYALVSLAAVFVLDAYTGFSLFQVGAPYIVGRGPLITLAIVLPPAFVLGMSFPITQRAIQNDPAMVGRRVGIVQLCNILGNTAGAVVTGLVLLHWLGTAPTLRAIGAGCLAFSLMAFIEGRHRVRDGGLILALAALIAFFPGNAAFWSALHGTTVAAGAIVAEDRTGLAVLQTTWSDAQARDAYGGVAELPHDTLFVTGIPFSRLPFLTTHGALGILGAVVHPDPQEILVIGQGTGGTPIAAGVNPKTRSIRVAEIVAPVFDVMHQAALRSGEDVLHRPLRDYDADPRYTRIAADARHLLLADEHQYDLIEADATYATTSLAGQLYSTDFFRLALQRLKPGGYMVQWEPTRRTLASFLEAFPYVVRINGFVLIGSAMPIAISNEQMIAELAGPAGEYLTTMGWNRGEVVSTLTTGQLQRWTPNDPRTDHDVNTDLFPKDEYYRNTRKIDVSLPAFFRGNP